MGGARQIAVVSLIVVGLSTLIGLGVLTALWPTWLTGGSCELSISGIIVSPVTSDVQINFSVVLPYGSCLEWPSPPDCDVPYVYWKDSSDYPSRFARWPSYEEPGEVVFQLATDEEKKGLSGLTTAEDRLIQQRLILEERIYRIKVGEDLVYYRRMDKSGRTVECRIHLRRTP